MCTTIDSVGKYERKTKNNFIIISVIPPFLELCDICKCFFFSFFRSADDNKLFIESPKHRKLNQAALSGAWNNRSSISDNFDTSSPVDIPLSQDVPFAPSRTSQNDRTVIVSNTRNIAALAAKKRNKVQTNTFNIERQMPGEPRALYRPNNDKNVNDNRAFLTPSRLDKHNKFFVTDTPFPDTLVPSEDSLSTVTKNTAISEPSLPPLRRLSDTGQDRFHSNVRQWVPVDPAAKRKKHTYSQQVRQL